MQKMITSLKGLSAVIMLNISMVSFGHAESLYSESHIDKASTLGVGFDLSESFTLSINGRLGSKLKDPYIINSKVVDDYRLDLSSFAAMVDWHPGVSGFRVSAGLLYKGRENGLTGQSSNTGYQIGSPGYTSNEIENLTGRIDTDSTAPYLGIAWRNEPAKRGGFSFSAEAGVLFRGNSSGQSGYLAPRGGLATKSELYQDEENILNDVSDRNEIYPVLNLGISYTY